MLNHDTSPVISQDRFAPKNLVVVEVDPYLFMAIVLLQVPVADAGHMLVDAAYLQKYLVDFGNEKMEANWARTTRLHHLFQQKMMQLVSALC